MSKEQDNKVMARQGTDGLYLLFSTSSGNLHPVENEKKAVVLVESQKMADKISQIFPGLHLAPGSSFVIMSLDS